MDYRKVGAIFTIATIILIIVVDVWLALAGGSPATISVILKDWSYTYNFIPYGLGIVGGHWFLNRKSMPSQKTLTIMMVSSWITIVIMAALNVFLSLSLPYPFLFFVVGIIVGAILWPLKKPA